MGSFSNELNDFVKGFSAGAVIANNRREMDLKDKQLDAVIANNRREMDLKDKQLDVTAKHYADIGRHYDNIDAAKAGAGGQDVFAGSPYMTQGAEKFGGAHITEYDPSKVPAFFGDISKSAALPDDFLSKSYWLESRFGQNTHNNKSSAGGPFQFTDGTAKAYGLADKNDLRQSAEATAKYAMHNRDVLKKVLGREPTGAELYLAHQQDSTRAAQLLRNPNTPAIAIIGRDAVVNNGGREDMTAGQFANMWLQKYNSLAPKKMAAVPTAAPASATPQATAPMRGVDDAEDDFLQYGSRGGMIQSFAEGGAVEQPYYATDLMNDVGNALGKLPEVIHGAMQGIQDMFGLNERPAIAEADQDYKRRLTAFYNDEGAPPPQQVEEVRRTVDPDNDLGEALGTTYGMVKTYEHYLARGDLQRARQAAGSIVLYARARTRQLGALAHQALEAGDESTALKALKQAFELTPNGQTLKVEGNKAIIVDQKSGQPVKEMEINEASLMNAAMGFTQGQEYYNSLMNFAKGEFDPKYEQAGVKADAQVTSAGVRADATRDAAIIGAKSREEVAKQRIDAAYDLKKLVLDATSTENDKKIAAREKLKQMGIDSDVMLKQMGIDATATENDKKIVAAEKLKQLALDAHSEDTDKRIAARRELADLGFANAENLLGKKQEFQGEQKDKDRETKRYAVDVNANTADKKIASSEKQTTEKLGVRQEEGAANRASREGIAADRNKALTDNLGLRLGVQQSEGAANRANSRANTLDRIDAAGARQAVGIDAKKSEGAANRASREGIAADNRDAGAAKQAIDLNARSERQNAGINARVGAAQKRQADKEIERVTKMTDHQVLGFDEATTPKVNPAQAQATRTIARSIVESAGAKYSDQGLRYARQITAYDPAKRGPMFDVKLNEGKDGYSATMPDGVTVPMTESGYQEVKRLRNAMMGARR